MDPTGVVVVRGVYVYVCVCAAGADQIVNC
jgi:hypothetical protein